MSEVDEGDLLIGDAVLDGLGIAAAAGVPQVLSLQPEQVLGLPRSA